MCGRQARNTYIIAVIRRFCDLKISCCAAAVAAVVVAAAAAAVAAVA